jgi:hypothetical protein
MKITVTLKSVFGNEAIYPADEHARIFCRIAGTKTLTPETLRLIRSLGYEIIFNNPRADELAEKLNGGSNV